ncbi:hypothetical protein F4804DRAFT_53252 [Jackrogersella minutella]|nr:hypothetical protein F4804DRAFT_53252 [Jackrogersella minutella]
MALSSFSDEAEGLLIFSLVMGIICTLLTILRFALAIHSNRKVGVEDWFALGALMAYLAYITCGLIAAGILSGNDLESLTSDELLAVGRALFATVPFYPINQFCAKFSILFLYYRLFSVNRGFVRWTYIIGTIQAICSTVTLFINLFSCIPISYNWNFDEEGSCLDQGAILAATESVNSGIDLVMVALAIFMVQELRLRLSTKLKLSVIFALGSLSGIIGYVRIAEFFLEATPNNIGVFSATQGFWESAQMAASIICCSTPIYKHILPLGAFYTRIVSQVGSFRWRRPSESLGMTSRRSRTSSSQEQGHPSVEKYRDDTSDPSQNHQEWLSLDDSIQGGLTWVEMDTIPPHAEASGSGQGTKTVQLEHTYETT